MHVYLLRRFPFEAVLPLDACDAQPIAPVERLAAHFLCGGVLGLSLPQFDGLEVPPVRDRDAKALARAARALIGPNAFEEARAEVIMSLRRGSGNERRRRGGLKSQRLSTPRRLSGR